MRVTMKIYSIFSIISFLIGSFVVISGCGEEKVIIRYREIPPPLELISPVNDTLIHDNNPTFLWHAMDEAAGYHLQVSSSASFINKSIDIEISDTIYTAVNPLDNGSFYWRVRGINQDNVPGDWSDAEIWIFYKTDNIIYIQFISSINTVGIAQDLIVRNDTAYIADGQADLTLIDVADKGNPFLIRNIDTIDDVFAKAVYISPVDTFPYVWVADDDKRVQGINLQDTLYLTNIAIGRFQNVEDVTGEIIDDTLYIFAVSSLGAVGGGISVHQIVYDPFPHESGTYFIPDFPFPADANGVFVGGNYVFIACGVAGLMIFDFSDVYNPYIISILDLEGSSLSVFARDDYVYLAADRAGIYVVDVTDKANPFVASQINTSGRTKDVHVVGDYAFIADGSGGLKVIDVSVPDSAHFTAAYDTHYAYGVYADSNYIYICDRDDGLMIFENLVVE